ncbi:hypothetical protein J6590_017426 [Homalodisca vitripennis]|nr:hypothetical protein J6590_017426 [Homalodisca vitripennis]
MAPADTEAQVTTQSRAIKAARGALRRSGLMKIPGWYESPTPYCDKLVGGEVVYQAVTTLLSGVTMAPTASLRSHLCPNWSVNRSYTDDDGTALGVIDWIVCGQSGSRERQLTRDWEKTQDLRVCVQLYKKIKERMKEN